MKKLLRNESGSSLVLTIFLIVLISIIGVSLITMNTNSMKLSKNEQTDQTVYYVAEAGLNYYIEEVRKLVVEAFLEVESDYNSKTLEEKETFDFYGQFKTTTFNKIFNFYNGKPPFKFDNFNSSDLSEKIALVEMSIENAGSNDIVHFVSEGIINGQKSRTLKQSIEIKYHLIQTPKKAIIKDSASVGDIIQENGEIDSFLKPGNPNNPSKTAIYLGNPADANKINGNFVHDIGSFQPNEVINILPTSNQFNKIFSDFEKNKEVMRYHKFESTNYTLNGSTYVDNSEKQNIDKDTTITIKPIEKPTNIYYSNNMNINNNGSGNGNKVEGTGVLTINVEGSSGDEVNIIVNGDIVSNNKFTINANPGVIVNLIVKGNVNFNSSGNSRNISLDANVIAMNANLITSSDTKLDIKGTFITASSAQTQPQGSNNSSFGGICAPNSQIGLNGKINLTGGIVVAGIAYINGGGSFDYTPTNLANPCGLPSIVNGTVDEKEINYYHYELPADSTKLTPSVEN